MSYDVVAEAVLDVDEDVAERLAVAADDVGFLELRRPWPRFTQTGSAFILIGCVLRRRAVERDHAFDVAGRGGVDFLARRRGRRRRRLGRRIRRLLAAAARDDRGRERQTRGR